MENTPKDSADNNVNTEKSNEQNNIVVDETAEEYKKIKDWFIIIDNNTSNKLVYDRDNFETEIKNGLISGNLKSENKISGYFKDNEGKWAVQNTTIKKFSMDIKGLKMMYDPILRHALEGLKWGALIGIGLKLLDTTMLLGSADPTLAILFLAAIGVCFIPKIGIVGVVIAGFLLAKFTQMNFFMIAISSALVGAILGCLPGMFLGGIIGWIRRDSLPKAHDSNNEPSSILLKTVVLPLLGAVALIYSYVVYFNQWLLSILQ